MVLLTSPSAEDSTTFDNTDSTTSATTDDLTSTTPNDATDDPVGGGTCGAAGVWAVTNQWYQEDVTFIDATLTLSVAEATTAWTVALQFASPISSIQVKQGL